MKLVLIALAAGVTAATLGAAAVLIARAHAEARRRRTGGPRLEWTRRARFPVWRCSMCGLAFLRVTPAPTCCPNPRCSAPWLWESPEVSE